MRSCKAFQVYFLIQEKSEPTVMAKPVGNRNCGCLLAFVVVGLWWLQFVSKVLFINEHFSIDFLFHRYFYQAQLKIEIDSLKHCKKK